MKIFGMIFGLAAAVFPLFAQTPQQKIFEAEKAFEKAVADKGINEGFIRFLAPDGVIFMPEAVNGREYWQKSPPSSSLLTWDPLFIDVSSNGAIGYSFGSSIFSPLGKDDPNPVFGHYLSIWSRQSNGEFLVTLDLGITHEKPSVIQKDWKSPDDIGLEKNEKRYSVAEFSVNFYEAAEKTGAVKAYKDWLADDVILLRDGRLPVIGKKAALSLLKKQNPRVSFAKRKAFIEAADMAFVYNTYTLGRGSVSEMERGNFVQVWKFRKGKWLIAVDAWLPVSSRKVNTQGN